MEIHPVRYACAIDKGNSAYPLLDFIGLIDYGVALDDSPAEAKTVKCTRNAAASIALACSESSYEQAALILKQLAGIDVTAMAEFRVTDSVGTEFVQEPPAGIGPGRIAEMGAKVSGNALESKVYQLTHPVNGDDVADAIQKALRDGPEGIPYKGYKGPTIKVMYVLCDGTGVPGRHLELSGAKGKQPDGSAKTFEAKIGAVFTVEYAEDGKPLLTENGEIYRDKKVCYMGTVRKAEDFGAMLYRHAVENGLEDMDAVVFLGDGAKWLWGIQQEYFPFAMTGIDLYHATERVNAMVDLIQFKGRSGSERKQAFKDECIGILRCGKVQDMLDLIESMACRKGCGKRLESAMGYFSTNIDRMNYGAFAAAGVFVGSGVIEAGCKVIVGNRMKNAGMHWSKDHAEKMIALRCAVRNGGFLNDYLRDSTPVEKAAA